MRLGLWATILWTQPYTIEVTDLIKASNSSLNRDFKTSAK